MYRAFILIFFFSLFIFSPLHAKAAEATSIGSTCTVGTNRTDWDSIFQCSGGVWKRAPYFFGASVDGCDAAHGGTIQWTGSAFQFCNGSAANWASFVVTSTGNVGIGTVSPAYTLDVSGLTRASRFWAYGNTGTDLVKIQPGDDLNPTYAAFALGNAAWTSWPFLLSKNGNIASLGTIAIQGSGTNYIMGNLGVGIDTPQMALDVNGMIHVNNNLYLGSPANVLVTSTVYGPALFLSTNAGLNTDPIYFQAVDVASDKTTLRLGLGDNNYGDDTFVIGTTLNGWTDLFTFSNNGWAYAAAGWTTYSDNRLKKDIHPLSQSMLTKISQLTPVVFKWRDSSRSSGLHYGFIAQDLQKIFPEMVTKDSSPKQYLSVDYAMMVVPLTKAVQELKEENAALAKRLARLEQERTPNN